MAGKEPKTVGFSFFSGQVGTVAEARAVGESAQGWSAAIADFEGNYMERFNLQGGVEKTIGLWETPEPSLNASVHGTRSDVIAMAKEWGKNYNQQAMALLLPNEKGPGGKLIWDLGNRIGDDGLDALIQEIRKANARITAEFVRQNGLPGGFTLGLTVKGNRRVEIWLGDEMQGKAASMLLSEAIAAAGTGTMPAQWLGGFDFRLLFAGADY